MAQLKVEVDLILANDARKGVIPPLWEGKASERITNIIVNCC